VTRLRDLFDESVGTAPPSSLRADAIYAAGRRRRTIMAPARTGLVALTVLALGGGVAYGAARLTADPYTTISSRPTRTFVSDVTVDG
jgi:hypothetical protein